MRSRSLAATIGDMAFTLANVDGRAALVRGGEWFDVERASDGAISADPMLALVDAEALHQLNARLGQLTADGAVADIDLGPPVPRPRNSYGIGLNYRSHAAESNMELPENPLVFTKFPSCIVGPDSDVELRTETGDYEVELVVVIGKGGRDIPESDAWDHIVGVTCGQDISDRRLQFSAKPPHFDLGKSRDTYGPIGPVLVSTDQFDDPTQIDLSCTVNGEARQSDNTRNLIFTVAQLVAYLSAISTLATGDLIFTGTPEGVGAASKNYLKPGDIIVSTLQGVGTMTNHCLA